jgi:hypothetical protein
LFCTLNKWPKWWLRNSQYISFPILGQENESSCFASTSRMPSVIAENFHKTPFFRNRYHIFYFKSKSGDTTCH